MKTMQGSHFRETKVLISPSSSSKKHWKVYFVPKEIHCCLAPEPWTCLKNFNLLQHLAVKYTKRKLKSDAQDTSSNSESVPS